MSAGRTKTSVRKRMEFIEFLLNWEGKIGRPQLQEQFGTSLQQATVDLRAYGDQHPENIAYDPRLKAYVRPATFKPALTSGSADDYLTQLRMMASGYRTEGAIWPVNIPEFEMIRTQARPIDSRSFRLILNSINERKLLLMGYVSMGSKPDGVRKIAPTALAYDGHRWHVRAYDCDKQRYSDFVLSRMIAEKLIEDSDTADLPSDEAWRCFVELKLQPADDLGMAQKQALMAEYAMGDGLLILSVRKAMLFYYLRHYGFDPSALDSGRIRNTSSFNLEIANIGEIDDALGRRS